MNDPASPLAAPGADCPICHGVGYVRLDVPVGHPQFGKAMPCRCRQDLIRQRRLARLRQASNLESLQRMTFDTFETTSFGETEASLSLQYARDICHEYAEHPQGWLLMHGTHGCGKTHLAAAIANARVEAGLPVLFEVVPDLLDHLRASYAPQSPVSYDEHFALLRTVEMLILDDFGTQNATPWAVEKLFQLMNYRYNAQLPTVITTNQTIGEMDPRLASRFGDRQLVQTLDFYVPDFRMDGRARTFGSLDPYQGMTFSTMSDRNLPALRRAQRQAADYAEHPANWLVIRGGYGVGKTHLAAAIANKVQRSGMRVLFVVAPDLLDYLRATFQKGSAVSYDRRFNEVRQAPFLVLDDLGVHSATDWAEEKFFQILNHRYIAGSPTVLTISDSGWERLDERLRGRLENGDRCAHILLDCPPYRGREAEANGPKRSTRRRD